MLRIFLLAALRNLLRHKAQTLINIASLALALTVFGFAFIYVKQELSYDRGWPEGERVHRLLIDQRGIPGALDQVHNVALNRTWRLITDYFASDIEAATRMVGSAVRIAADPDADFIGLKFVELPFADMFQLDVVEGDLRRTLSGPGFIAMDEGSAERLDMTGRVGERITLAGFNDGQVEYELAAIYRVPQPVSAATAVPMFTLMHDYSLPLFDVGNRRFPAEWEQGSMVWLKLRPGVGTKAFNARQPAFIEQNITAFNETIGPERKISDHLFYRWQPVSEIHFNPITREAGQAAGDIVRVITFATVGLLVLLVGCSNSVSLSLAAALERRREIGVRKAAGALPHEIMRQQLAESVLRAMLALLPALLAVELLAPTLQALLPIVRINPAWRDHALLAVIAVLVGLACGAYPALVLSATRPQAVLRAGAQQGMKSGMSLRTILVAAQFCFASILLIGTAALYLQLAVARTQALGFDTNNVVLLEQNEGGGSMEALRVELEKVPGVVQVTFGASLPPNMNLPPNVNSMSLARGVSDKEELTAQTLYVDLDFIDFMGMRILAGRGFDARLDAFSAVAGQVADGSRAGVQRVVINATAARELGFAPEDAINQTIFQSMLNNQTGEVRNRPMQIIGVMEDNLYLSLRRRPGPTIYMGAGAFTSVLMVRYDDTIEDSIQARIQEAAQRVHGVPLQAVDFVEPQIAAAFMIEQNESKLLLICGGLALMLASFGLYGLAAFAIERQVKEVGVRKVMGAGVGAIVALYLWRFSRPIVLANLLAWPVAIYFVLQWIQRFPYQMERVWLAPLCIATLGAVLLIALLTVSVITTRAANANPVRSLRYE